MSIKVSPIVSTSLRKLLGPCRPGCPTAADRRSSSSIFAPALSDRPLESIPQGTSLVTIDDNATQLKAIHVGQLTWPRVSYPAPDLLSACVCRDTTLDHPVCGICHLPDLIVYSDGDRAWRLSMMLNHLTNRGKHGVLFLVSGSPSSAEGPMGAFSERLTSARLLPLCPSLYGVLCGL